MPDHVYLSLWLREYDGLIVLEALRTVLEAFPYSASYPKVRSFSVQPVDWSEPPSIEEDFAEGADVDTILGIAQEFQNSDCAYEATVCWDLAGTPKAVKIAAYAPDFEGRDEESGHLELDLGTETTFLTNQENVSKLIALGRNLSRKLPLYQRRLWTESGENFADKVSRSME